MLSFLAAVAAISFQVPTEQYSELTDSRSEVVNFFPEPMRAMAVTRDSGVWSLNPLASTLVFFSLDTLVSSGGSSDPVAPDLIVPTGLNPVSLALWTPPGGELQVLVVCAGTHGMFAYQASDGALVDLVLLESDSQVAGAPALLSEGADIVVDAENSWAFVSCPSTNTVLKIDLSTSGSYAVEDTYHLPVGERPGPLLLEPQGPGPQDNKVLVAMTVTGNNSIFLGQGIQVGAVVDVTELLEALQVADPSALPDEDIYLIHPMTDVVEPYVIGAGSLLLTMERNAASDGDLWILSSDSVNSDLALNSEPLLRGRFLRNQLAIVDDDIANPSSFQPSAFTDLDDTDTTAAVSYSSATSINQARALAVRRTGNAFIAGPFSDQIVVALSNGDRLPAPWFTLDPGSQCYDLELLGENEQVVLAYCLGSMRIEVIFRPTVTHYGSLDLGLDPTPDQIKRGRAEFLDGSQSQDGRLSCASCHPRAMTDQLAWSIEDDPLDHKDAMLTQSLLSIADTFPHHWRGERDLKDFQGAFGGLLGASPTDAPSDADMDDLIVFFQSLQAPANPLQSPLRILDDTRRELFDDQVEIDQAALIVAGSARSGQDLFTNVPNFGGRTCQECHQMPTGGDGNMSSEVGSLLARETNIEVPHLRQLQHRSLNVVNVPGIPPIFGEGNFNVNGFGATHHGGGTASDANGMAINVANVFDFITKTNVFVDSFGPPVELMSVAMFVQQFDQGISPACHWAVRVDDEDSEADIMAALAAAEAILIDGFNNPTGRWNEVVVYGEIRRSAAGWTPYRAYLVEQPTGPALFESDDPSIEGTPWGRLKLAAAARDLDVIISGMPLGNSERFATDFDRDGLRNGEDPAPYVTDADDDGFPDGYDEAADTEQPALLEGTLDFNTARLAKYHVRFDEDVLYRLEYSIPGGPVLQHHSVLGSAQAGIHDYVDEATFVLTHDHPSGGGTSGTVTYAVTLFATDRAGNPETSFTLPPFTPDLGGDQDDVEFLHVEGVQSVPAPIGIDFGTTYEGEITAFAFEIEVAEDELAVPGQAGYVPGADLMVFFVVTEENLNQQVGEPAFEQVIHAPAGSLETNHATSFKTTSTSGTDPYTALSDYIVSSNTDSVGKATVVFGIRNLAADQDVKISVQGIMRPAPGSTDPLEFLPLGLAEYQPLLREGAAIGLIERP